MRLDSSTYAVNLPFNEKKHLLGNSRNTALQRLYSLERRFVRDQNLKNQYVACMQDYLDKCHMTLASNAADKNEGYYLPHQAVIKQDSLTTKVRVVFDASCKTSSGLSLNDTFMVGPTIQSKQYTLNTVTFGTTCAPFLATRTLRQVAEDESQRFFRASEVVNRDFYVDDCLTGADNLENASKLQNDLIDLLKRGGFNLRKWDASTDSILYTVNLDEDNKCTKRSILSQTAKLFGPQGLLGPVIIVAKILIQDIWKL